MANMEEQTEKLCESLVIRSLKRFRDRFLYNTCKLESDSNRSPKFPVEDASLLDRMPVRYNYTHSFPSVFQDSNELHFN